MVYYYFYLFSLSDGGHLGILYKNEIQTPNKYLIWILVIEFIEKMYLYKVIGALGSKLNFSKWGWRPSLILASRKNCQDFWEEHGG